MSARPEADPQIGRTLGGQYRIEALLGAGGMGRVYRGRQLSVNRSVAIKLIAGQAPYPSEWVRRFRREAEATASLSHPNSVRLFDFGVTESEELFMVMELLEGSDLARQLQARGPLPLTEALSIARQVLLALCEAHALGITHRDIKPDNIFLASVRGADVVAKVMDFGIAGIAQAQRSSRLTGAGMIIGTPMYMSPEQAQGLRVDGKSDVYSLGVVLFEMLTGRPVFESHTAVTLLLAHVARAPMRLDEAGVQLREQSNLQALLDRLLAKDPSARPTAAEALDTVTALSSRLGVAGATGSMRAIEREAQVGSARRGRQSAAERTGTPPPDEAGLARRGEAPRSTALPDEPARATHSESSSGAGDVQRALAVERSSRAETPRPGKTPPPASSADAPEHALGAENTRAPRASNEPEVAARVRVDRARRSSPHDQEGAFSRDAALPVELSDRANRARHALADGEDLAPPSAAGAAADGAVSAAALRSSPTSDRVARGRVGASSPPASAPLAAGSGLQRAAEDAHHEESAAAELVMAANDVSLAPHARQFRSAHAPRAPTGAWLRPAFVLLGTGIVLGAASALALRWGPTLIEAARPANEVAAASLPEQRTVLIDSQPSGASVLVDGEKVGTTPFGLEVRGDTEVSVARDSYVRQLVRVPYDARTPLLVKLAALPVAKPNARDLEDKPFFLSLRQESLPRIAPRADSDHERRDRSAQAEATRARVGDDSLSRADTDREQRDRAARTPVGDESLSRADTDREQRDRAARAPVGDDSLSRADTDRERRDRAARAPVGDDSLSRADTDREQRDRAARVPGVSLSAREQADSLSARRSNDRGADGLARVSGAVAARADDSPSRIAGLHDDYDDRGRGDYDARELEKESFPGVAVGGAVRAESPGARLQDEHLEGAGLDVARVLEMGREGVEPRAPERANPRKPSQGPEREVARAPRGWERERAHELASEHGPTLEMTNPDAREREEAPPMAAETSRSAATGIEAIREDEVSEIALDEDERAHVAEHYGLRAIGRAVARAFGRLLIPYPNRERRAALAKMPLMYLSFRDARAAYKNREIDATGFQEAVWQLRERRRQKIWTERDRYARGELSQGQYQAKVDRIWDEFWGPR